MGDLNMQNTTVFKRLKQKKMHSKMLLLKNSNFLIKLQKSKEKLSSRK